MRKYLTPNRDQSLLFPPDLRDWIPEDHLAKWMIRAMEKVDLSPFYRYHEEDKKAASGRPPYDPAMMLTMIFYALALRESSSRKIEALTYSDIGARYIMGNQHPDHSVFAEFRDVHKKNMEWAFAQVLYLCHSGGLIDLSLVAIDSTVIKASANKANTIRTDELEEDLAKAICEAERLLRELDAKDAHDREELKRRLKKEKARIDGFNRALKHLEAMNVKPAIKRPEGPKAQADYEEKRSSVRSQLAQIFKESRQTKGLSLHILAEMTKISMASLSRYENALRTPSEQDKLRIALALDLDAGALPKVLDKIAFKAAIPRINTIDVESYLIKREQTYYQGYLSQIAVDSKSQVVVAAGISPTNSDQTFVAQAITQIAQNLQQTPKTIAADSGYCSEDNLKIAEEAGVDFLCPPGKLRPGAVRRSEPLRQMEARLAEPATWKTYLMRAQTVEPVFGDKKLNQGFDRYFVRGLVKVAGDWFQKMTVHNLMKLFRAQILP